MDKGTTKVFFLISPHTAFDQSQYRAITRFSFQFDTREHICDTHLLVVMVDV